MQQETQGRTQQQNSEATEIDAAAESTDEMSAGGDSGRISHPPPQEEETPPEPSAEERIADLEDKWRRALAETRNVRRRADEEYHNAQRFGIRRFAGDMLSVCDNLGRALESADNSRDSAHASDDEFLQGIQAIRRELHDIMERHGVRQMQPLGERFDPNYHEAVFEAQQEAEQEFDVVVQVVQQGYMLHERLLRPARVGIARGKPAIAGEGAEDSAENGRSDAPGAETPAVAHPEAGENSMAGAKGAKGVKETEGAPPRKNCA